eukprot:m.118929 g.118929  ORF g.118929 m.118929 type:complete len:71 (-) comp16447_c0_seq2:351-563(-)
MAAVVVDSPPTTDEEDDGAIKMCLKCKTKTAEFASVPCGCPTLCKKCAMKVATGGYCMQCHELFSSMRRL